MTTNKWLSTIYRLNNKQIKTIMFTKDFLNSHGFNLIETEECYGKASQSVPNPLTLYWNTEGKTCDYYDNKLNKNIAITIKADGSTRIVFNGIVYTITDFENILKLIK